MNETVNIIILFIHASVPVAIPLLLGTLGEILTEKSGNLNLGVEGMMYMGAACSLAAAWGYERAASNPIGIVTAIISIVAGFLAGALGCLIYSVVTVTFRANQNVTGLTLTIFGTGVGNFIGELLGNLSETGVASASSSRAIFSFQIPGLSSIPYLGNLLFSYDFMVYLTIVLAVLMSLFLRRTRKGLNLRSVGESPATADAAGINVTRYKYLATCIGGGICGLGGAYITMARNNGQWVNNCVGGQGWIAVALVIFATWSPLRAMWGALLFGALSVVQRYLPSNSIPTQLFNAIPFIATILVLILTSIRQSRERSQPKSCGTNYFREER